MKAKLWILINQLIESIKANSKLKPESLLTALPLNKKQQESIKTITPKEVFCLHREMNGLTIYWVPEEAEDPDVIGKVKIIPVEEILQDWKDVVFFDFTPQDERIRYFHPIDFFVDECCTGAFLNEPASNQEDISLYLYRFEGEPIKLYLGMEGYLKMLIAAKGFLYWQYSILEILEGRENPTSKKFKDWMPRLFEEFSWEDYVALYQEVRLTE